LISVIILICLQRKFNLVTTLISTQETPNSNLPRFLFVWCSLFFSCKVLDCTFDNGP
jgi:hypothetical protein